MPASSGYRDISLEDAQRLDGLWVTAGIADAPSVPATPLGWELVLEDLELVGEALARRGVSLPRRSRRFVSVSGYAYHSFLPLVAAARELVPVDGEALALAIACEALAPVQNGAIKRLRGSEGSLTLLTARVARGVARLEERVVAHERDASQHYRWLVEMDLGILPDGALKTTLSECWAIQRASRRLELESTLDLVGGFSALLALARRRAPSEAARFATAALVPDALELSSATPALALFSTSRLLKGSNAGRAAPSAAEFLRGFGERGPRERELYAPRWVESPWLIERCLALLGRIDSRTFETRLSRARHARERDIALGLTRASKVDGILLRALGRSVRRSVALRSRLHLVRERALFMLRTVVLDMDRRLCRLTGSAPDSAFFLRRAELVESTLRPAPSLAELTAARHAAWRSAARAKAPPTTLGRATSAFSVSAGGHAVGTGAQHPTGSSLSLFGFGLGELAVTGRATIAHDFQSALEVEPGGVLVLRALDPGWAPLLPCVGAVVTDSGGATDEGVLLAAALGIVVVVGTRAATTTFENGVRLRVDPLAGSVCPA